MSDIFDSLLDRAKTKGYLRTPEPKEKEIDQVTTVEPDYPDELPIPAPQIPSIPQINPVETYYMSLELDHHYGGMKIFDNIPIKVCNFDVKVDTISASYRGNQRISMPSFSSMQFGFSISTHELLKKNHSVMNWDLLKTPHKLTAIIKRACGEKHELKGYIREITNDVVSDSINFMMEIMTCTST